VTSVPKHKQNFDISSSSTEKKLFFPIIITLGFFISTFYLTFFHHPVWTETDGIYYLNFGRAILDGNGHEVIIVNGQIGAPVLFAFLESIFHDAFAIQKSIAVLSGSGIVFFSFLITRNVFDYKIATVVSLFFAFHPRLIYLSTQALNELLPILMIMGSLFLITRKQTMLIHYILIGTLLGFSSIFRLQAGFVLLAIIIFLLIRNRNVKKNISSAGIVFIFFILAFSPQIIYNFTTHDVILDTFPGYYISSLLQFQTPEWHQQVENSPDMSLYSIITLDIELFLKNYFYNLFSHNPDRLFNFGSVDNLSIIPLIPYISLIFIIVSLVYLKKSNYSFKSNFLPLLLLPIIYLPIISLVPIYRSYHLLPIWLPVVILCSIFVVNFVPEILSKLSKRTPSNFQVVSVIFVIIILFLNVGFAYKLVDAAFYGNTSKNINIANEFERLFQPRIISHQPSMELQHIASILSKDPNIEQRYIMANSPTIPYYTNSNFILAVFNEGNAENSINDFILRDSWTEFEIFRSNIHSFPPNRTNQDLPMPDYVIYQPHIFDPTDVWYEEKANNEKLLILQNPDNSNIPSNFSLLYQSNQTNTVVYKIIHNE